MIAIQKEKFTSQNLLIVQEVHFTPLQKNTPKVFLYSHF